MWYSAGNMKVIVVLPAYNAAKTLKKTINDIPKNTVDRIILVDDASQDKTVEIARKLGIQTFLHRKNKGYGGNQKTCYQQALLLGADVIVMLHPDYQYDPKLLPLLVAPIKLGYFDIMLGARIRSRRESLAGGMPAYKYFSNRVLTFIENLVLGLNLSEYHTGYRAYSREVLKKINFKTFSNDFIFDQEMLVSAHKRGFKIGEVSVPVKYFPEASSINFLRSLKYGIETLKLLIS